MPYMRVRIKATGQVIEVIPSVGRAMVAGGTAEEVRDEPAAETAALDPGEKAVTSAQKPPKRKTAR